MLARLFLGLLLWPGVLDVAPASAAPARSPEPDRREFRIRHWATDDGLPQGRVACLQQTRDGYLWVGTWAGLARFDGLRFAVFNKLNTPAFVNDTINALAEDANGTLWIGTRAELVGYGGHRFQRVSTVEAFQDERVWQLLSARGGGLWVHAGDRVARFAGGKFSRAWKPPFGQRILSLQESPDGWLNIFTDLGWLALSPTADQLRTNYVVGTTERPWLAARLADRTNCLWLGTSDGLFLLDIPSRTAVACDRAHGAVDMLWHDTASKLWANVNGSGLCSGLPERSQRVELGEGLTERSTLCAFEDLEGNVWLGHDLGLFRLSPLTAHTYATRKGFANDDALSVCEAVDGAIWVGTSEGLSCIREGRVFAPSSQEPLTRSAVRSVWPRPQGGIWLCKQGWGLFQLEGERFLFQANEQFSLPGSPNVLYGDSLGRLWVGTDGGAVAFQPNQFDKPDLIFTNGAMRDVRSFLQTRDGAFWFGTIKQGLARLQNSALTLFTRSNGLSDNSVWSMLEDGEGTLWIGTDNGFNRYKNGRFFAFGEQHGLPESTVNCVLEDDAGDLWLSGLHGIHRAQRAQLNGVADGQAPAAQFVTLGTADGMENPETNGGENQPAGWKAHDGRLWFPTVRGVVVIDPKMLPRDQPPPPVVIEEVKAEEQVVFGDGARAEVGPQGSAGSNQLSVVSGQWSVVNSQRPRTGGEPRTVNAASRGAQDAALRLGPGRARVVEFRYTANTFVAPEHARFRYRLVGADSDWREETSERTVRYINLKPGDYRFEVTAADHHNVWNPQPAAFAFSLAPHFWQTWAFYLLCGSGLAGLVLAVQGYRPRWQRRLLKLEEQRALANERTRIARDLHDDLGTALTGLALELDVAGCQAKEVSPLAGRLSETAQRTRDLAERMREVVWTVNPECDTVSSLASFLEQQVSQFLKADGLRLRLDFPEDIPPLPLEAEAQHQLALSVREALTNVVRHAQATEVTVSLAIVDQTVRVQVKDNGCGFRQCQTNGHGLANMKARMERVRGSFECLCAPDGGTTVIFVLPLGHQTNNSTQPTDGHR